MPWKHTAMENESKFNWIHTRKLVFLEIILQNNYLISLLTYFWHMWLIRWNKTLDIGKLRHRFPITLICSPYLLPRPRCVEAVYILLLLKYTCCAYFPSISSICLASDFIPHIVSVALPIFRWARDHDVKSQTNYINRCKSETYLLWPNRLYQILFDNYVFRNK